MTLKIMICSLLCAMSLTATAGPEIRTKIIVSTPKGDMTFELYNETPKHRDNFIKLIESGFYDSTLFHRCIPMFMIQGGDPDSRHATLGQQLGAGDVGYTVPAEFNKNLIHRKGALCAARMGDQMNPSKSSSGCQFYIVSGQKSAPSFKVNNGTKYTPEQYKIYEEEGGTPHLDMNYTVFGQMIDGFDVLEALGAVRTDDFDRPIQDIPMSIRIVK